ncbi:CoA-substrate-specific enzyme activase [Desulfitobacterium hafniense DCB-2]|uniref:CoA-substrate-specific enzyme activase n=1 Tax=Desulfitobacterium hafniense (strain DSM 10664 / DCB-2) TaxID=272564 RepID=B8FZT5_DESHD|nr:acyl-CoA dehydratase activase [Desulfitobacterium hafniense]ACL19159.1 CoA-substrate-specific enzyme activase [Desulfitobacterium hafniense DCB-2]
MIVCGCDLGSATGKAVLLKGDKILSWAVVKSARNPEITAQQVLEEALDKAGLVKSEIHYVVGTGYGRTGVSFIQDNMSEITCHARGAHWMHPNVRTVVDIGGQDCKVIALDEAGKVLEFGMNDKCAAGTGRFFEAMARVLDCTMSELSTLALNSANPANITKQCSVFAESEVVTMINNGVKAEDIAAGIHDSIARRIHAMTYKIGIKTDVVITGGCARNEALTKSLEKQLGVSIHQLTFNPQIAGALGAALLARDRAEKRLIKP